MSCVDCDKLNSLLRQREEELSLLLHEGIQITASLHDDEIPTTEPLSVNVEDVRTLRAQLKQREEEIERLKATAAERRENCIAYYEEQLTDLRAQLAASQARSKQLEEALGEIAPFAASWLQETYADEYVQHASYVKVQQLLTPHRKAASMTDEQAARNVFDDWHDNKAGTELPRLDQVSLVAAIAAALAARERAVWLEAAKLIEDGVDVPYECGPDNWKTFKSNDCKLMATMCRQQANGEKNVTPTNT